MKAERGFTLVEVLVALMIVALGLTALMVSVSGTARTSGYLREKTMAQWIALNRLSEVRLNLSKFAQNTDAAEVNFAGRTWHYDTRYFDTSISSMKRVVVRVYEGNLKTKGPALAESTSFTGAALGTPGGSNIDWSGIGAVSSTGATTTPAAIAPATTTPAPGTVTTPQPNMP